MLARQGIRALSTSASSYDVLIMGGGVIGSSLAHFLSRRMPGSAICVVERDSTYRKASTPLSVGAIRQQFSIPENVRLSVDSADFIRNAAEHLRIPGEDEVDLHFHEHGYMFLATAAGEPVLRENFETQRSQGAEVQWMTPAQIGTKYPWLNLDGIAAGVFGPKNEGWFDPWLMLQALRKHAIHSGVRYEEGEIVSVDRDGRKVSGVTVRDAKGAEKRISCGTSFLACGAWADPVARMAGFSLPIVPRLRHVFMFHCPDGPRDCPMLIDPSGVYVRTEDPGHFLCGRSPPKDMPDPDMWEGSFDVDYGLFEEHIWPTLAERVKAFESIKVRNAWAGLYEYNTLDQNPILGLPPHLDNLYCVTGFSGHGLQHAPAVARAMTELFLDGHYSTIDLSRFNVERVMEQRPIREKNVV